LATAKPVRPAPPPASSTWQFQAIGYGWATAINGEVGVHNLPPVDVNADFPDVLKRLDAALMGSFLAKNGEWMVMTDLVWAKLSDDTLVKPPGIRRPVLAAFLPGTDVELGLRQLIASSIAATGCPSSAQTSSSMRPPASLPAPDSAAQGDTRPDPGHDQPRPRLGLGRSDRRRGGALAHGS
jgi:hypothetical protein